MGGRVDSGWVGRCWVGGKVLGGRVDAGWVGRYWVGVKMLGQRVDAGWMDGLVERVRDERKRAFMGAEK